MKNLMLILIFATAGSFQTAKGLFIQPDSKIASKDQDSDGTTKIIDNNMVGTKIVDKENVDSKTSNGRGGIIGTEIFDKDIIAAAMEIKEKTFEDRAEIVDKVIFDTENVNSKNVDEEKEEESETYTCFPWLFNPGLINTLSNYLITIGVVTYYCLGQGFSNLGL